MIAINLTVATDGVIAALGGRLSTSIPTALRQILLMILFGPVEFLGRKNFSDDWSIQCLLMAFQRLPDGFLLLRRVEVYSRPVLSTYITSLHPKHTVRPPQCQTNEVHRVLIV